MKNLRGWPSLALSAVLLLAAGAQGQERQSNAAIQSIQDRLSGAAFLMLRGMYEGRNLAFDAQGNLIGSAGVLPFSLSAVLPKRIRVTDTDVEIDGARAGLEMQPGPDPKAPQTVSTSSWASVKITIARDPQHPEFLQAALQNIFSVGLDDQLLATVPDYWRPWLWHQLHPNLAPLPDPAAEVPATVGRGNRRGPRLLRSYDPEYPPQLIGPYPRGLCMLGFTVDATGHVQNVRIVKASGMGLDEAAVASVKKYRFKPAFWNGMAVPVRVKVAVNFQAH